ncbi:MAG: MurT ligase domain-containing protein [Solirubrobacteraceae bacterium]
MHLRLPGEFNRANALMAGAAAHEMGVPWASAVVAMESVEHVAGRFGVVELGGFSARLALAKNPAGWGAMLDLVCAGSSGGATGSAAPGASGGSTGGAAPGASGGATGGASNDANSGVPAGATPIVVAINARAADGSDPSWLWDVPFERLRGRLVVATGERWRDLSVRLHYAEVEHRTVADPIAAVRTAALHRRGAASPTGDAAASSAPVDVVANYTAFSDLLARAHAGRRT